jgi:hypothetical protein
MTEYSNLPDASTLYQQREAVTNAITMLDGGGSVSSMNFAPAPPDPEAPMPTVPSMFFISAVTLPPPTSPEAVAAVRGMLVERQATIDAELAMLGVTNPPAAAA